MVQSKIITLVSIFLLYNLIPQCPASKILGVVPTIGKSHWIAMSQYFKELAIRGHQVTVLGSFPPDKPISNYTHLNVNMKLEDILQAADQSTSTMDMGDIPPIPIMYVMVNFGVAMSNMILNQENTQKLIREHNDFDVVIFESFFTDALLGFAHKFNAPSIAFCTFVGDEFVLDAVGNPYPYSYVPSAFLTYTDHMSFYERLTNAITEFSYKVIIHWLHFPNQDAIMRKHFGHLKNLPSAYELYHQMSLILLNSHESIAYPKPLLPNVIQVAGVHIKQPGKLPKDIQSFMDDATDGVILFSMGSHIRSADFLPEMRQAFLKIFSSLKQKILWKFEEDNLPTLPKNVKISKWLPQNEILAHPKIKLFITHGGGLSTQEATYHGVPVIGIPILGDQKLNMARTELSGCGLTIYFDNITETSIRWALNEVLNNPRYSKNAKYRSELFKDRLNTPLDTAVYWTEYIIRHKGAPHLRSAALDLTWYQYYLVDVIATLILSLITVLYILFVLLRSIFRLFTRRKVSSEKKRK